MEWPHEQHTEYKEIWWQQQRPTAKRHWWWTQIELRAPDIICAIWSGHIWVFHAKWKIMRTRMSSCWPLSIQSDSRHFGGWQIKTTYKPLFKVKFGSGPFELIMKIFSKSTIAHYHINCCQVPPALATTSFKCTLNFKSPRFRVPT